MVKNRHLAKAILDVAWGQFFAITKSKAESAGRTFERVNPRYTSQTCSNCGHRQKMPLTIRVYECEKCGFVCDRDHKASRLPGLLFQRLSAEYRSTQIQHS